MKNKNPKIIQTKESLPFSLGFRLSENRISARTAASFIHFIYLFNHGKTWLQQIVCRPKSHNEAAAGWNCTLAELLTEAHVTLAVLEFLRSETVRPNSDTRNRKFHQQVNKRTFLEMKDSHWLDAFTQEDAICCCLFCCFFKSLASSAGVKSKNVHLFTVVRQSQ